MNRRHALTSAILLLLLCAAVTELPAGTITIASTPNSDGSALETVVITDSMGNVHLDADGMTTWTGNFSSSAFDISWDLWIDPDPGVGGTILVTNNTASTQFYSTETGVFSSVNVPAGGIMQGSSAITVADTDNSGTTAAMAAPIGDSIYSGKIGGVTQRTMFSDPFNLTAPPNGTNFNIGGFASESTTTALPIGGLLSLRHAFRLTAGDSATALSTFVVNWGPPPAPVPEPTSSVLLGLGVLGLVLYRRKRTLR